MKKEVDPTQFHLLVDAGGFARGSDPISQITNEYLVRGLHLLGYKAINLGYRELYTPPSVWKSIELKYNLQFINANILLKGSNKPLFKPYLITEIAPTTKNTTPFKKLKIGILGLCDNAMGQIQLSRPGEPELSYLEPEIAAKQYLPELTKSTDLVILLYYGKFEKMSSVIKNIPGIDVVIMGGETYRVGREQNEEEKIITVTSPAMGKYVGILTLTLDSKKAITSFATKQVPLTEEIADDSTLAQLVKDHEAALQKPR